MQTQNAIKNAAAESTASNNDINHATGVIQDADNSRNLLSKLQEVAQRHEDPHPIDAKLQQAVCDVHNAVCDHLQVVYHSDTKTD